MGIRSGTPALGKAKKAFFVALLGWVADSPRALLLAGCAKPACTLRCAEPRGRIVKSGLQFRAERRYNYRVGLLGPSA